MSDRSKPHRKGQRKGRAPAVTIAPGRELALLALCHLDQCAPTARQDALDLFWKSAAQSEPEPAGSDRPPPIGESEPERSASGQVARLITIESAKSFAEDILARWLQDPNRIDEVIEATSERWRLARMDVTDRNAIRLATLELDRPEGSKRAIVADAVRLASRYGSERSARFVNGLVESLAKRLRGEDPDSKVGD